MRVKGKGQRAKGRGQVEQWMDNFNCDVRQPLEEPHSCATKDVDFLMCGVFFFKFFLILHFIVIKLI